MTGRTTYQNIKVRFEYNVKRVNKLIELYNTMDERVAGSYGADLLRAAVVLLHAALEDVLRNMVEWKLPQDKKAMLARLKFPTADRKEKCSLLELAECYPTMTVEAIQQLAFDHYLNHMNWGSRADVEVTAKLLKMDTSKFGDCLEVIDDLFQRRHAIVHQGDRDHFDSRTHGRIRDLEDAEVRRWLGAVEKFIHGVLFKEHPLVKRDAEKRAAKK